MTIFNLIPLNPRLQFIIIFEESMIFGIPSNFVILEQNQFFFVGKISAIDSASFFNIYIIQKTSRKK